MAAGGCDLPNRARYRSRARPRLSLSFHQLPSKIENDNEHDWRVRAVSALSFRFWPKKRIEISVQNFSSENQSVRKPDLQRGADFFRDRSNAKFVSTTTISIDNFLRPPTPGIGSRWVITILARQPSWAPAVQLGKLAGRDRYSDVRNEKDKQAMRPKPCDYRSRNPFARVVL